MYMYVVRGVLVVRWRCVHVVVVVVVVGWWCMSMLFGYLWWLGDGLMACLRFE